MRWRDWLGVGERRWKKAPDEEVQPAKTLWDWLQLLIVPTILIGVTFVWSATQTRSDNRREDRRIAADRAAAEEARRDATFEAYLNQMSRLMLDKKLLTSKRGDAVRAVARTVTLTALRRLDGERRGAVVRFLAEARLLEGQTPRVFLQGADLREAVLTQAFLVRAYLGGADLRGAALSGAVLGEARLSNANLMDADLRGANLSGASLARAKLKDADLSGASLAGASLAGAKLKDADLRDADLRGADLVTARLGGTQLGGANLAGANLSGANLADADLEYPNFDADLNGGPQYVLAKGLDLGRYITDLPPERRKVFLALQKGFLDSLSRDELLRFNLSPEKLAKLRKEARGLTLRTPPGRAGDGPYRTERATSCRCRGCVAFRPGRVA
jgi:uncharacterized protein YjbI with pentapeptide repeats